MNPTLSQVLKEIRALRAEISQLTGGVGAQWLGEREARRLLGVGKTFFHLKVKGEIKRRQFAGRWKYSRADLQRWINSKAA